MYKLGSEITKVNRVPNKTSSKQLIEQIEMFMQKSVDLDFQPEKYQTEETNLDEVLQSIKIHSQTIINSSSYIDEVDIQFIKKILNYYKRLNNNLDDLDTNWNIIIRTRNKLPRLMKQASISNNHHQTLAAVIDQNRIIQIKKESEEILKEITEKKAELETLIVDELQNNAIKHYEKDFQFYADKNRTEANRWRYALIILIFAVLVFISLQYFDPIKILPDINIPFRELSIVESNSLRIALITTFSYMIFFSSKNYSICKNNQLIYEQKHTMIKVYIPFVKTISETGLDRDKVTVELGKILFDIRGTGFIKNDGGHEDSSLNSFSFVEKIIK